MIHNGIGMHLGIKLRHIRAFLDIAAEGSLTAVARTHGLTQPALSRSLAELETLLGQSLFLRQGRRLVLTEAGAVFRRYATSALQSLETGARTLKPDLGRGRLRVGVLPTVAATLFPRVALRFGSLQAGTTLSVETGPHTYLIRRLREGAIDLMVGRMPVAREMSDLTFEHLYEEEIVLCARRGHPLAGQTAEQIVRNSPLILPTEGALIRRVVEEFMASLGLVDLQPAFETVSLAVGRGLVLGSDAVWFISRGVIQEDLDRGDLAVIETQARFLSGAVGITMRQESSPRPGLDMLLQITRQIVRE
jgi:LysR family pca operon transcriptional activator